MVVKLIRSFIFKRRRKKEKIQWINPSARIVSTSFGSEFASRSSPNSAASCCSRADNGLSNYMHSCSTRLWKTRISNRKRHIFGKQNNILMNMRHTFRADPSSLPSQQILWPSSHRWTGSEKGSASCCERANKTSIGKIKHSLKINNYEAIINNYQAIINNY